MIKVVIKKEKYSRRLIRQKRENEKRGRIRLSLSRHVLERHTDPDLNDILREP